MKKIDTEYVCFCVCVYVCTYVCVYVWVGLGG